MINHARTLLTNLAKQVHPTDEYVSPDFAPVTLPGPLRAARRVLFGENPDRLFLNWRTRQLLSLVAASSLAEYVTALDRRVTYSLADEWPVNAGATVQPAAPRLTVLGDGGPAETVGRCEVWYSVRVDGETCTVAKDTPPNETVESPIVYAHGLSPTVALPQSTLHVRWPRVTSASWQVVVVREPRETMASLLRRAERLGQTLLHAVFGGLEATAEEPWCSFWNAWQTRRELIERLSAFVLGLIYSSERHRHG